MTLLYRRENMTWHKYYATLGAILYESDAPDEADNDSVCCVVFVPDAQATRDAALGAAVRKVMDEYKRMPEGIGRGVLWRASRAGALLSAIDVAVKAENAEHD